MTKNQHFCITLAVVFFALLLFLAPFSGSAAAASKELEFADVDWDSVQVHNRIAGFILKHGYGYEVDYLPGNTIPLFAGLARGDIDINMEVWIANQKEAYEKAIKAGQVIDLGSNFPDSWQGWMVPTYVIEGNSERGIKPMAADLKSVFDMPEYWELFKDPEDPSKGIFYSCIPGWECEKINEAKIKTYGLDKYYNHFPPGSYAALVGSLAAAYKRGEPWFGYHWAPTWPLGKYNMTPLEEPPFDQEVWDKNYGCAYPSVKVNIVVHESLPQKAPEVVAFLKKYETTQDMANKFLAYMEDADADAEGGAIWFLQNYKDVWHDWVPSDILKKVEAALP